MLRSRFLLIALILLVGSALDAQGQQRKHRSLEKFAGRWILNEVSTRMVGPETWVISVDNDNVLKIRKETGANYKIVEVVLDIGRSETNTSVTSVGKRREIKSRTAWEGDELVRRYTNPHPRNAFEKMYVSEYFSVYNDGQRLRVTYLHCPEGIWPTNSGQEKRMCFDEKWTFSRT